MGEMIVIRLMIIFSSFFYLFSVTVLAQNRVAGGEDECYKEARCGEEGPLIKFPFRLKNRQPDHCGYPGFELYCNSTNCTALELPNFRITVFVHEMRYKYQTVDVYNPNKCGFPKKNFQFLNLSIYPFQLLPYYSGVTLFNCSSYKISEFWSLNCLPCLSGRGYSVCVGFSCSVRDYLGHLVSCAKISEFPFITQPEVFESNKVIRLIWSEPDCSDCESKGKICRLKRKDGKINETEWFTMSKPQKGAMIITGATVGCLVLVLAVVAIHYAYTKDKSDRENRRRIKKFLEDYEAFKPSRYTYSDIKRITNQFKEELGRGAYGTVFKGKLCNEVFVAVKMLNDSQGNGEQFVNEVATIGRIHHVNVVRLVGYCAEGVRRALIYEFLPTTR